MNKEVTKVLFLCDEKACDRPCVKGCKHTSDIDHAKNFNQLGHVMIEQEDDEHHELDCIVETYNDGKLVERRIIYK